MAKMVVSISVIPIGTQGTNVSRYVSRAISVIERAGLTHRVSAGFTDVELDSYGQLASILSGIESELSEMGVHRIDFFIKIDRRLDSELSIEGKVSKVSGRERRSGGIQAASGALGRAIRTARGRGASRSSVAPGGLAVSP